MSLNPSCNNVEGGALPVLGDPPFAMERAEIARGELRSVIPEAVLGGEEREIEVFKEGTKGHQLGRSGIYVPYEGREDDIETICTTSVTAEAYGWQFHRAWYYWICSTRTNPIPEAAAKALNEKWGKQVRFDGFSGGKDVDGPGDSYHVDTLDGLRALVAAIRER